MTKTETIEQGFRIYYKTLDGILVEYIKMIWNSGYKIVSTINLEGGDILFIIELILQDRNLT